MRVGLGQIAFDAGVDCFPEYQRQYHHHDDAEGAFRQPLAQGCVQPAQRIYSPGFQQGERGDQADRPAQQQGQGGKVTVGPSFQGGEAVANFLTNGEAPFHQPIHYGHDQPGGDQDHGGNRGRPGQVLKAAFEAQHPNADDGDRINNRQNMPDVGEPVA